ncbi:unnamed protein product [Sphenostylis stenocarpa]|uniref:Uncharacterized protein n=1 Tax=Sphenostylis stenocarpa TaxID=92480 RepID=A0AA86VPV0_9FABA|nr:unnamed protein product [Sphenostylis stenocarpa]
MKNATCFLPRSVIHRGEWDGISNPSRWSVYVLSCRLVVKRDCLSNEGRSEFPRFKFLSYGHTSSSSLGRPSGMTSLHCLAAHLQLSLSPP